MYVDLEKFISQSVPRLPPLLYYVDMIKNMLYYVQQIAEKTNKHQSINLSLYGANVPVLARPNAFLGKIRKVENVFGKKFSLQALKSETKLLRICL